MHFHIPHKRLFWAVSIGHFFNDTLNSAAPIVLTFLASTVVPMTATEYGLAISASQLLGAVSQPFFGLWADRTGGRWIGSLSPLWTSSFLLISIFIGVNTGQYWLMFVPYVLKTLGSGMFHPVGAMHAAESETRYVAGNMAFFFLMGQLGLAMGPVLIGTLLDIFNPPGELITPESINILPIVLITLVAIPSSILMATSIPSSSQEMKAKRHEDAKAKRLNIPKKPIAILILMVVFRSLVQPGSVAFIPVLFESKGWSVAEYSLITSSFWIAAGISGVIFGQFANRYDRRWIMTISMVLSAPAFFFLPAANGLMAFVLAMLAGGLSGGSHSIIVVLAQDLIPASKGFASGSILGIIFGTGALGSLIIGILVDSIGIDTTFQLVAVTAIIAGALALLLPASKPISEDFEEELSTL